ncbi:TPA: hypothetical protein ACL1SB_005850 [Pseudomonas aeruginosa]
MSSTQHQLIEQCAIRLRGIVEALDNIHDSTQHRSPHRWSTDLDDVHSSAESLLAMIKDQAPTQAAQGLAGAALAQLSPAQAVQHWPKLEKPAQVGAIRFRAGLSSRLVVEAAQRLYEFESTPEKEAERIERLQAFREQCFEPLGAEFSKVLSENLVELSSEAKPEQAEAEQPVVVGYRSIESGMVYEQDYGLKNPEALTTVAECERIVRALRAEIAEWQEAAGRSRSDVVAYIAERAKLLEERDAALAEVNRLRESKGDPSGSFDRCMRMMYERDENAKRLDAALAKIAELEAKLSDPTAVHQWQFSNAWFDGSEEVVLKAGKEGSPIRTLYAAPVAQAQHSAPDVCDGKEQDAFEEWARKEGLDTSCHPMHWLFLDAKTNSARQGWKAALRYVRAHIAAPSQAQHSVPDGAADLCRFLAKLYCELDGLRYSTAKLPAEQIADALIFKWPVLQGARNQLNIKRISEQPYDESKLHSAIAAMLAAAPGTEVPQAWLDVQAERRRQVTAEGWTPEHDDAHSHGQMARAAACYALAGSSAPNDGTAALLVSLAWPWDEQWWKPTTTRRDLVKACALGLAEIERLDRAGISQNPQPGATTASS